MPLAFGDVPNPLPLAHVHFIVERFCCCSNVQLHVRDSIWPNVLENSAYQLLGLATNTNIHVSEDLHIPKACCKSGIFGQIHTARIGGSKGKSGNTNVLDGIRTSHGYPPSPDGVSCYTSCGQRLQRHLVPID